MVRNWKLIASGFFELMSWWREKPQGRCWVRQRAQRTWNGNEL